MADNVALTVDEWYPVYTEATDDEQEDLRVELPDDLARRLRESTAAFQAVQCEIRDLLAERRRRRQLEERRAQVEARRRTRGPGRIRRRPRPDIATEDRRRTDV